MEINVGRDFEPDQVVSQKDRIKMENRVGVLSQSAVYQKENKRRSNGRIDKKKMKHKRDKTFKIHTKVESKMDRDFFVKHCPMSVA